MACLKIVVKCTYSLLTLLLLLVCQTTFTVIINSKTAVHEHIWYLDILVLLVAPEILVLLTEIWSASFIANGRFKEWPLLGPFLLGVLFSLAEGVVVPLLIVCILPLLPVFLLPLLLNGCFLVHVIFRSINNPLGKSSENARSRSTFIQKLVYSISVIACLCAIGVLMYKQEVLTSFESSMLPLTSALISVVWFCPLQNLIHGDSDAARQNSNILYSILKIISFVTTVYKIAEYKNIDMRIFDVTCFSEVFRDLNTSLLFWYLIVHMATGLILQFNNFLLPRNLSSSLLGIIPCVLSPLLVGILYVIICLYGGILFIPIYNCSVSFNTNSYLLYAISVLLYLIPSVFIVLRVWKVHRGQGDVILSAAPNYFIYNSVFISQTMLLRLSEQMENAVRPDDESIRRSRIFICTTMYQEAQHEMDRLLKSLSKISDSKALKRERVYLESHIFLDNGAKGFEIKEFGIQLLALMEDNFEFCKEPGVILHTPYGIQLSWERGPEMSLYIHLKDSDKVKPKKRWSQVMYMKHILEYRSKVSGDGTKFRPLFKNNSAYSLFKNSSESLDTGIDMRMFTTYPKSDKNFDTNVDDNNASRMQTLQIPKVIFGNSSDTSSIYSSVSAGDVLESDVQYINGDEMSNLPHETVSLDRISDNSVIDPPSRDISRWNSSVNIPTISASVDIDNRSLDHENIPSYILSTDADMAFDDVCVIDLLDSINQQSNIGGVCGRTYPIGVHKHPIVWLQMFDYAKDFWMIKSAQNIIGSVMCCPGCLSLYRFEAVSGVLQTYSESTQNMEDVFTKDNGEDRWMCTLMMMKGWELRYTNHGKNSTYCPEETAEFMKQRRRWLLSDFANAAVVLRNMRKLMAKNNAFTLIYVIYLIQLFFIMILYPGSTIIMLSLGLELASGLPLIIATPVLAFVPVFYCFILMNKIRPDIEMTIAKLLIFGMGVITLYIFSATSIIVVQDLVKDFGNHNLTHIEHIILLAFMGSYLYAALLHPREAWILVCGLPYLFYLPLLNIFLPIYAVCNIVDQTWGTRDGQKAKLPNVLRFPKFGRKKKKLVRSLTGKASSYASLSSSAPDLTDYSETETDFWTKLVESHVGKDVNISISSEDRDRGLHKLRKKALTVFLLSNGVWILLLCGFYAFLLQLLDNKSTYGIVMGALLGLSPLIQMCGMTVYRIYDGLYYFGKFLSR